MGLIDLMGLLMGLLMGSVDLIEVYYRRSKTSALPIDARDR